MRISPAPCCAIAVCPSSTRGTWRTQPNAPWRSLEIRRPEMAILVGNDTKVICQGMTGRTGTFYTERAKAYGTRVVAGVRPGKGGSRHLDMPVFDSVGEA